MIIKESYSLIYSHLGLALHVCCIKTVSVKCGSFGKEDIEKSYFVKLQASPTCQVQLVELLQEEVSFS